MKNIAMKAAKNEMNGLSVIQATHVSELYTPLMCVVSFP